jgi:FeS assembly protein IscX
MFSSVELQRILSEWRMRLSRAKEILQPPTWKEDEWRQFSQALALMVRDHGRSWIIDPNVYYDLRWTLQDGGELVCQIEHIPGEKTSLVVAQNGGFAAQVGSYTWLWAEFNMEGAFARDPYWVEGTWKDALTTLLMPLDRQAAFLLAGRAETPAALLLQEGARPNDQHGTALLTGINEARPVEHEHEHQPITEFVVEQNGVFIVKEHEIEDAVFVPEESKPAEAKVTEPVTLENGAPAESGSQNGTTHPPEQNGHGDKPAEPARIDTPQPFAIRWGMPQKLTWKDTDEIAYSLIDAHPDQDPLKLSFPKLHKMILELEDFGDDPDKSSESILETIQMAWYEEVK